MNEQEFLAALQPVEPLPILYRLYYNDLGEPLFYSQENLPGNYIDIDREMYINPPTHLRVINNSIVILQTAVIKKLYPGRHGKPCHPLDISVVVDDTKPNIKWSLC